VELDFLRYVGMGWSCVDDVYDLRAIGWVLFVWGKALLSLTFNPR